MYQAVKSRLSYAIKLPIRTSIWYLFYFHRITDHCSPSGEPQEALYLNQGRDPCIINVFDQNGVKKYTIERTGVLSSNWIIFSAHDRIPKAKISLGSFRRTIEFFDSSEISEAQFYRDWHCSGMFNCQFTLKDGSSYVWTHKTRYLEQVILTSDGKELRKRVARAKLLRKWSLNWEIAFDPSFDPLVTLATAFMPMQSQWDLAEAHPISARNLNVGRSNLRAKVAVSPSHPPCISITTAKPNGSAGKYGDEYEGLAKYLIYDSEDTNMSFFNPPKGF